MLLESSSLNDIDMTSLGNAVGGAGGVSTTSGGNGKREADVQVNLILHYSLELFLL